MQINTGEMTELSEEMEKLVRETKQDEYLPRSMFPNSPPTKKSEAARVMVGDIIDVHGCPCRVVHINAGKRRISLETVGKMNLG